MAGSLNKVTLIGNLGKDPESRSFNNGGKVVNFSVATSETWNDRSSGEKREKTEWTKVAIFSEPLGKIAEQYLRKGSKVYLEGKLQTRKWQDQSGKDMYTTEVVLQGFDAKLIMLDGKSGGGRSDDDGYGGSTRSNEYSSGGASGATTGGSAGKNTVWDNGDGIDDDVPF